MSKLDEIIKIADIQVERIERSRSKLHPIFPLDAKKVQNLAEEDFLFLEMLVGRFAKLQDIIGKKLIDQFLLAKGEFTENLSMIDKVNKLEKLGLVEDADLWKKLRDIRNHASHEYPDHPELAAKYLNQLFESAPKLINILNNLKI